MDNIYSNDLKMFQLNIYLLFNNYYSILYWLVYNNLILSGINLYKSQ